MTSDSVFNKQVDRNSTGLRAEKAGRAEDAIRLYEKNIQEGFEGNGPYDRLAVIYRRLGRKEEEIRVLRRAIEVFEKLPEIRSDVPPKLEKFKQRLAKVLSSAS